MLPIEIVNKILVYVGELNHSLMITQYEPSTNKEYYKINLASDFLWQIKASVIMKRLYPCNFDNKRNYELYKHGIPHYRERLKEGQINP